MEIVKNYLDIQLRDMDYLKVYNGNVRAAFFDPSNYYETDGYYEKKYEEALNKAKEVLTLNRANTIKTDNPILQTLIKLYRERRDREKEFIKGWENFFGVDRKKGKYKLTFPMNGDYSIKSNYEYAKAFSSFIQNAIGNEDDEIIQALRSDDLAKNMAGLESAVYSMRAANRAAKTIKGKKTGQSDINLYYENLFDLFFFGKRGANKISSLESVAAQMGKMGSNAAKEAFKSRFKIFIDKYYGELTERIQPYLDNLGETAFDNIYKNFNKNNPKDFIFKRSKDRGVSELTQKQLKKMLLTTIREIANASNKDFSDFSIPGLLIVNPDYRQQEDGFHMQVQVKVEEIKSMRKDLLDKQIKGELINGKKIDMRNYNRTLAVAHDDDMVEDANGKKIQLKQLFLNYLYDSIEKIIKRSISPQEKENLSRAVFQKIDKTIKRADKALETMSIYGPGQMKGFLSEIATAYSLQSTTGAKSGKIYTEITGKERGATTGGQLHYDVVALINNSQIGFQVKGYSQIENREQNLYATTIGLGRKEMYKYFGENTAKYRWLFANGRFISQYDSFPDLREQIETSLYNSTKYFLRISDASIKESIDSDIYVIGNFYIPSSYLIVRAIEQVKRSLNIEDANEKLFTLTGDFPKYRYKKVPKTYQEIKRDPKTGEIKSERLTEKHETEGTKRNLVYIKEGSKTKMFGKININFKGINIRFNLNEVM